MGGQKAANGASHYVDSYLRIPKRRAFWESVRLAIYDPEEKTVLGRSPKRWGILGLIYLIMYISIIIFTAICFCGLYATLDDKVPKYTLKDSLIGQFGPGLGYRPLTFKNDEAKGALIWYNINKSETYQPFINNIREFLKPYKNQINQTKCVDSRPNEKACKVNTEFGNCTEENNFGFSSGQPCIFIKINKMYGWQPDYYGPDELPDDFPQNLRDRIIKSEDRTRKHVWLTCFGENPADKEAIGELEYHPDPPGAPDVFFPYDNRPHYLSPLIAVQFKNITRGQIVYIRCRGWAKNQEFVNSLGFTNDRKGSCHVELLVDPPPT